MHRVSIQKGSVFFFLHTFCIHFTGSECTVTVVWLFSQECKTCCKERWWSFLSTASWYIIEGKEFMHSHGLLFLSQSIQGLQCAPQKHEAWGHTSCMIKTQGKKSSERAVWSSWHSVGRIGWDAGLMVSFYQCLQRVCILSSEKIAPCTQLAHLVHPSGLSRWSP